MWENIIIWTQYRIQKREDFPSSSVLLTSDTGILPTSVDRFHFGKWTFLAHSFLFLDVVFKACPNIVPDKYVYILTNVYVCWYVCFVCAICVCVCVCVRMAFSLFEKKISWHYFQINSLLLIKLFEPFIQSKSCFFLLCFWTWYDLTILAEIGTSSQGTRVFLSTVTTATFWSIWLNSCLKYDLKLVFGTFTEQLMLLRCFILIGKQIW